MPKPACLCVLVICLWSLLAKRHFNVTAGDDSQAKGGDSVKCYRKSSLQSTWWSSAFKSRTQSFSSPCCVPDWIPLSILAVSFCRLEDLSVYGAKYLKLIFLIEHHGSFFLFFFLVVPLLYSSRWWLVVRANYDAAAWSHKEKCVCVWGLNTLKLTLCGLLIIEEAVVVRVRRGSF